MLRSGISFPFPTFYRHFATLKVFPSTLQHCTIIGFSRMRSKGSRFTLGVWGLRVCSLDVAFNGRNRPQPFATEPSVWAVPMASSAKGVLFGGFRRRRSFVSRGRRGTSWHSDMFHNVSKSFCVAGAILLRRFQKMCCIFRGRRNTLDDHRHFSWQAQHFRRVVLRVFCNRIVRAASSGDKVQIPWQAWHFVRCAENWRKPRTKHRFWGSQFSGSKENS